MKQEKVAIIGAGIIGLYLAYKLSQKGIKVSVFEKKSEKEVGFKSCSTLVSERIKGFFSFPDEVIENTIDYCKICFPRKEIILNFKPKHLVLNREELIKHLICLNRKNNVEIVFDKTIDDSLEDFDRVIACDGALSKTRERLKIKSPKFKIGIQATTNKEDFSNIVCTYPIKSGFLWKIPRGKTTEYGIFGKGVEANEQLKSFLKENNLQDYNIFSAPIPQSICVSNKKDIALCGDAMGLTKPWSGGGIIWGVLAVDILLKNYPDFDKYNKEVLSFFRFKIIKGRIANNLVHFFGNHFPYIIPKRLTYDNDFSKVLLLK